MSILTVSPSTEIFSSVKHLNDALDGFYSDNVSDLIEQVGQVFVKHNAWKTFGLSLTHCHFEMSTEEILVETLNNEKTLAVAVPWKINEGFADPIGLENWKTFDLLKKKYVNPMNWCFQEDGELIPFEFLAEENNPNCSPSKEFQDDLFKLLNNLGIAQYVGVKRVDYIQNVNTWETTPEGKRANVSVIGDMPEIKEDTRMIQVVWHFDERGRIKKLGGDWCLLHVGSSCQHCSGHKK